jgi:hypothetical protein
MLDSLIAFGHYVWITLGEAILALVIPTVFFVALALVVKRREALVAAKRAAHDMRLNLSFYLPDAILRGLSRRLHRLLAASARAHALAVADPCDPSLR